MDTRYVAGAGGERSSPRAVLLAGGSAGTGRNAQIEIRVVDNGRWRCRRLGSSYQRDTVERMAISEADGTAKLAALPPGTHKLLVEPDGFNPVEQVGIVLRTGRRWDQRYDVARASGRAEVVVIGSVPLVDVVVDSTNVVPEQIESPVPDRNFENLAFITPGARERGGFRFIQAGDRAGGNASQSTTAVTVTYRPGWVLRQRFSQDAVRESGSSPTA